MTKTQTADTPAPGDRAVRTRAPGERSRSRVLEQAAALATLEGLDGISIARLADATGMPKSSVYVLFGSKEKLQLATIDAALASFQSYVERRVFPGGCFFVTASAELGGRPGPVHDRVALYQGLWRNLLAGTAKDAQAANELPPDSDPEQLAFELGTILAGTNIV